LRSVSVIHRKTRLTLQPRSESDGFIITHLAKPAFYQSVTLDDEIHPESIDGTWYPARYEATDPELVAPRAA
jgi:hypothetical protein